MPTLTELVSSGQVTFYTLWKHADVSAALRHPSMSSDPTKWEGFEFLEHPQGALADLMRHWLLSMDPPDHTRVRSLVNKAFTARSVERLRPRIQELTDELCDALDPSSTIELIESFAFPLPIRVICELLGVSREDELFFREASQNLAKVLDFAEVPQETLDAAVPFIRHMEDLIERRRKAPGEDLLSRLVAARDHDDRLSDAELVAAAALVLGAGFETTMNLIANGVYSLLKNPGELARMTADPSLVSTAVEEILRCEPPVTATGRTCTEDMRIGETEIHRGQQGAVMLALANRDPDVFSDPMRFDIGRAPNPHMTFGGGHHFCPGAALARLEGQIAIGTLFRRFPELTLHAEPEWRETLILHGLKSLWIDL